jgi:hypothetical protein
MIMAIFGSRIARRKPLYDSTIARPISFVSDGISAILTWNQNRQYAGCQCRRIDGAASVL